MRYLGGKSRQAKWILGEILKLKGSRRIYLEPFIGGGSVISTMAPHFEYVIGSDIVPELICLWREVSQGWIPPDSMTEEQYLTLKQDPTPSALKGWAAFAASYNGKYFAGYGPQASGRNYLAESQRAILKKARNLRHVLFDCCAYDSHSPDSDFVVYCDPPYLGTEAYQGAPPFDHARFWNTMDRWYDQGALVLVSEYTAPSHWRELSNVKRVETMHHGGPSSGARREILFTR
jgi:DNA adenine methylase